MPDPALFARSCLVPAARPPCAHSSAPSAYFSGFNLPDWKEAPARNTLTAPDPAASVPVAGARPPRSAFLRRHDPCPILHPRHRLRPRRSAAPAGPHDGHAGRLDGNIHRRPAPAPPVPAGRPQARFPGRRAVGHRPGHQAAAGRRRSLRVRPLPLPDLVGGPAGGRQGVGGQPEPATWGCGWTCIPRPSPRSSATRTCRPRRRPTPRAR